MLSGCRQPKSLSYDFENTNRSNKRDEAATLEDIDRFLVENFKSLYGQNDDNNNTDNDNGNGNGNDTDNDSDNEYEVVQEEEKEKEKEKYTYVRYESDRLSTPIYDSPGFFTPPLDLCGSHSNLTPQTSCSSLLEDITTLSGVGSSNSSDVGSLLSASIVNAMAQGRDKEKAGDKSGIPEGVHDCIAVLTVSPNPYEEFRKSMQGMLDARVRHNQRVDWDFMEELLFCYLRLNEKKQYRFILSAFVDLVVILRQNFSNGGSDASQCSDVESNDGKRKKKEDC